MLRRSVMSERYTRISSLKSLEGRASYDAFRIDNPVIRRTMCVAFLLIVVGNYVRVCTYEGMSACMCLYACVHSREGGMSLDALLFNSSVLIF